MIDIKATEDFLLFLVKAGFDCSVDGFNGESNELSSGAKEIVLRAVLKEALITWLQQNKG